MEIHKRNFFIQLKINCFYPNRLLNRKMLILIQKQSLRNNLLKKKLKEVEKNENGMFKKIV